MPASERRRRCVKKNENLARQFLLYYEPQPQLSVQLTTSRISNDARLMPNQLKVMTIHTHCRTIVITMFIAFLCPQQHVPRVGLYSLFRCSHVVTGMMSFSITSKRR